MPRIKISVPTLLFFASLFFPRPSLYTLLPLAAALLHECGHFLTILACGRRVHSVTVSPFGFDIRCERGLYSYHSDLLVCLGGVGANLLAVLVCLPHTEYPAVLLFLVSNLLLAAVNLLPIETLDGGCALAAVLTPALAPERAARILRFLSLCGVFFLWLAACDYLLLTGYHFSLFCMAIYLFVSLFLPPQKSEHGRE